MNVDDLRVHLRYLTEKYVADAAARAEIDALISRVDVPPVKAVMALLVAHGADVDPVDADVIKDIAFNYL